MISPRGYEFCPVEYTPGLIDTPIPKLKHDDTVTDGFAHIYQTINPPQVEIEQVSRRSYLITVHYRDSERWYASTMEEGSTYVWAPIPSLARRWAEWKARRILANRRERTLNRRKWTLSGTG